MSLMTIHLRCDPATGKKDIIIQLESDADALPHEHEQQHRALVDRLIEGGMLKATEVGKIVVERQEKQKEPAAPASEPASPQRQPQTQGQ